MTSPYIEINHYEDSPTGHVNVSFFNGNGTLVGVFGANVGDMDFNPLNGLEGGVYNETDLYFSRLPINISKISLSQEDWSSALSYVNDRLVATSLNLGGYYFLFGENCVDFVDDVLSAASVPNSATTYLYPDTMLYNYSSMIDLLVRGWWGLFGELRSLPDYAQDFTKFHDFWKVEAALGTSKHSAQVASNESLAASETNYSPISIDMNGNGIETIHIRSTSIFFDLDADGVKERTGWLSSGDGFLAVDWNKNNIIDNGSELFGGQVRGEGFAKLASFDSNGDKKIDENDSIYSKLVTWQDLNQNGTTDSGELKKLSESNITVISLKYETWDEYDYGNLIGEHSYGIIGSGAAVVEISDVYFRTSMPA